jgi:hypothetical protein
MSTRDHLYRELQRRALHKLYTDAHGHRPSTPTDLRIWTEHIGVLSSGGVCTLDPFTVLDDTEVGKVLGQPASPR